MDYLVPLIKAHSVTIYWFISSNFQEVNALVTIEYGYGLRSLNLCLNLKFTVLCMSGRDEFMVVQKSMIFVTTFCARLFELRIRLSNVIQDF